MSNNILDMLESLDEEDLDKVSKLIAKLARKHKTAQPAPEPPPVTRPTRQPTTASIKPNVRPTEAPKGLNRRPTLRDELGRGGKANAANSGPKTEIVTGTLGNKIRMGRGKKQARTEELWTGPRENVFETLVKTDAAELNVGKEEDQKFDKKNKNKSRTPRMGRDNRVWVSCIGGCCQDYFVDPSYIASEEGYTCNDCILGRK